MKNFQVILMIVFGFAIVGGLITFATYKGKDAENQLSPITLWGSFSEERFRVLTDRLHDAGIDLKIGYREIPENQFDTVLLEAIASGRGPDAVILPLDLLYRYEDKIIPISFETYPERDFKNTFIEASELFIGEGVIKAMPFTVDPLVMYWNRDMFNTASLANAPMFWDEFLTITPKLTRRDNLGNITKSAVALGEYRNITNAKGIVSALLLQSGNPIVTPIQGGFISALISRGGSANAINFYTEFANPVKPVYSWNRSLPSSQNEFLAGDLAVYFGYASELPTLRAKNPNLNFDVAPLPQVRDSNVKRTYGKMTGVAVLRFSPNAASAFQTLLLLTGTDSIKTLSEITSLPPVRRDVLSSRPASASLSTFYDSALFTRSFIDPDPVSTDRIFGSMIESVTSGQGTVGSAVGRADQELNQLLK